MRSNEALKILNISREHLSRLVKAKKIRVQKLSNGRYIYNREDVYEYSGVAFDKKHCIYARVSSSKQKRDLLNQVEHISNYCMNNGFKVDYIFSDIASGISFEKRKDFFKMMDLIIRRKIVKVYISYKDRLSRIGFGLFTKLFNFFGTEIVVLNESNSSKLDSEEIFNEIISLIHCFSMKHYSKRRLKEFKKKLKHDLQTNLFNKNEDSECE